MFRNHIHTIDCLSHLHHIGYWWICPWVKPTELLSFSLTPHWVLVNISTSQTHRATVFLTYTTLGTGEYFHESNPQSYCLSHLHHIGYWWIFPWVKPTELPSFSLTPHWVLVNISMSQTHRATVFLTYTTLGTGECVHESNPQSYSVRPLVADMESGFDGSYHVILRNPWLWTIVGNI
jgi:hypothetical protein